MLHHVGIEVAPPDIERSVELWQALGFSLVEPPASLREFTWLERNGTQIHLMPIDEPTVPERGHLAIVAENFEATVAELHRRDFEVERRREHWGEPRAVVIAPGGHRVEITSGPPRRADAGRDS
jgi:catechol 2,3-dioxygenase-like lactoylglutathione lyase family enzyme